MDKLKALTDFFDAKGVTFTRDYQLIVKGDGYNPSLFTREFPGNCGGKILTGYWTRKNDVYYKWNAQNACGLLEYIKYRMKGNTGFLMATINATQFHWEPVFERVGFAPVFDTFNPNHGPTHVIKGFIFDFDSYKKRIQEDEDFDFKI